jgi:hypothetical protein
MKNLTGWYDHRLESLEGRSMLSGSPIQAPAAPAHEAAAVVADAGFLNAASDASAAQTKASTNDADMYDFGGAWGTQALGMQVRSMNVDLDNGAVDQEPGGPSRRVTPADLSTLVPATYARAADYNGAAPVITANMDPVAADSPVAEEPEAAPVVTAPVVTPPAPVAQPQAPQAIALAAPTGDVQISWLDVSGGAKKKADGVGPVDQVVIASTFIAA